MDLSIICRCNALQSPTSDQMTRAEQRELFKLATLRRLAANLWGLIFRLLQFIHVSVLVPSIDLTRCKVQCSIRMLVSHSQHGIGIGLIIRK